MPVAGRLYAPRPEAETGAGAEPARYGLPDRPEAEQRAGLPFHREPDSLKMRAQQRQTGGQTSPLPQAAGGAAGEFVAGVAQQVFAATVTSVPP